MQKALAAVARKLRSNVPSKAITQQESDSRAAHGSNKNRKKRKSRSSDDDDDFDAERDPRPSE